MSFIYKLLEKRQAPATSGSVCQLVLKGYQPAGQLLCCENDNICLSNMPICSSTNKMAQCWFINELDSCKRTDALANTVCQYLDGVYCLKGETDQPYDRTKLSWSAIDLALSRDNLSDSISGFTMNYDNFPVPVPDPNPSEYLYCSDSMASGVCQIQDSNGYKPFNFQVEICNNAFDVINSPPQISNATAIVTTTATTTVTTTQTATVAPSGGLSIHSELSSLPLVMLLVIILVNMFVGKLRI
ncbi:hypothetical protein RclHR1_01980023 [Rhizophagus clarus]|uniref:Uncharacterized protein n=1 Tax=Rhizophagus clarus TaxID=94130 RepID=A0A2Z6RI81_9GLOM|nr:hypothetical protein RclHR1_01980023 [Rhizophagus clarus]GES92970.1 hypothetical protein GLOIN_2v1484262 [Rhizophagus clarus]